MKLSKTAWNNVIIFSVMIIILIINISNNRLFPEPDTNDELILPEHSVVLTLSMAFPNNTSVVFDRIARAWKTTNQDVLVDLTNQQIDQMMLAWQQGSGLVQAAEIIIEGQASVEVSIGIAGIEKEQLFTLYTLADQLLVYNQQNKIWLALPATMKHQLIPLL